MLNCTDLACVLHHHHFYAHLHHLKHHLQDDNDHTGGDGGDLDNNNNDIQGLLNDTDSELSSLSHVDAPNDVIYIVSGVFIAMVLVGIIIVLIAVTFSKIRKREEESSSPPAHHSPVPHHNNNFHYPHQLRDVSATTPVANGNGGIITQNGDYKQNPSNVWVFPPLPPQPNICANNQLALLQANDKNGLKGFKRQLSGRFKRLIQRKPNEPAPVIPPELKPQLKTIYVY